MGKSFAPNMIEVILPQSNIWQLKRSSMCSFNHITFLMSNMTCLNKTN